MNDTYFFGKRMSFNEGGRARFNVGGTGNKDAEAQGLDYISNNQYLQDDFTGSTPLNFSNVSSSGIMDQAPVATAPLAYTPKLTGDGGRDDDDDDDDDTDTDPSGRKTGKFGIPTALNVLGAITNPFGMLVGKGITGIINNIKDPYKSWHGGLNKSTRDAIDKDNADFDATTGGTMGPGPGPGNTGAHGGPSGVGGGYNEGNACFEPNTFIKMANGSEKKIKDIQLGDDTKGGEVTGVFQFKAFDEIHDYKGVTVAGSHYVKENGKFIMVKDSPLAVKINKIPVVYSLDTTGRRIFIKDIEFADYNGDGVAKSFLSNAGVDLSGFDKEVLRQVEHRLI
jgi:hypothetical protein